MKDNRRNTISIGWGSGESDLFLRVVNGKPQILSYEYDNEKIHELCGGKLYYRSRSGASGAGYINQLGPLTKVGLYRVNTTYNNFISFISIGKIVVEGEPKDVEVVVPHGYYGTEIYQNHPTVIRCGQVLVYCDFFKNFLEILRKMLSGSDLRDEYASRTLTKKCSRLTCYGETVEDEVVIDFFNLCTMQNTPNPWEFYMDDLIEKYRASYPERLYEILRCERLSDGAFVETMTYHCTTRLRGRIINDPLKNLPAGWYRIADDLIMRFNEKRNEAYIVAYMSAQESYGKVARRLAQRLNEHEEFVEFVSNQDNDYVEYEVTIPKSLFLIDEANQIAEARKGLARKIRNDVANRARQWIGELTNQSVLESIPDDLIITVEDSLSAGNCKPGTEDFIDRYFPGKTQVPAKELKKYASNYNVMRIFNYLLAMGKAGTIA